MRCVNVADRYALGRQQADRAGTVRAPGLRVDLDLRHRVLLDGGDSGLSRHDARVECCPRLIVPRASSPGIVPSASSSSPHPNGFPTKAWSKAIATEALLTKR